MSNYTKFTVTTGTVTFKSNDATWSDPVTDGDLVYSRLLPTSGALKTSINVFDGDTFLILEQFGADDLTVVNGPTGTIEVPAGVDLVMWYRGDREAWLERRSYSPVAAASV